MTVPCALFTAALMVLSVRAHAVDGMALEAGEGSRSEMWRVGLQWHWPQRWLQRGDWHVGGYWDLAAGEWHYDAAPGERSRLTDVGLTPVFRLQRNGGRGLFLEGGVGAHLLSGTNLGDKHFSTGFQFGDHVGFGYRAGGLEIGYRFQHLSNAGIKIPNQGINFQQVRLQYWFR